MESVNYNYLDKHKKFRIDSKKLATVFFISAFIVAIIVFWWLKLIGITVTGEAFCGLDEHIHDSECYISEVICGFDDDKSGTLPSQTETAEAPTESEATTSDSISPENSDKTEETTTTEASHIHTDECYSKTLTCSISEHTHTQACFPDKTADVETVSDWLSTFENAGITNNIPRNLISIAMTQVGYEESQRNFEYDKDGNKNGYTRYGEWYGNPYGKWNTMFVSFCLHYSNINNDSELKSAGAEALRLAWQSRKAYSPADEYTPEIGDIVFIDSDGDKTADSVAIILSVDKTILTIISGDSNDKVEINSLNITEKIIGYGLTGELSFAKDMEYDEESTEPEDTLTENEEPIRNDAPLLLMSVDSDEDHDITYITDLTKAVTNVTFRTLDNTVISDGSTIYVGQTYIISLTFSETNTGEKWVQFQHNDDHYLTYQLPSNLDFEPFTDWHPITATTEYGTVEDVGEYFIDNDGMLWVKFMDIKGEDVCFGQKYSNVSFTIDFNSKIGSTGSDTETKVEFNDKVDISLTFDDEAEMVATKTAGAYNSKDNTKEYTIRIEATKAVIKDLVVYDDMYTWNNQTTLRDTIVVTDLNGNVLEPQPTISDGRGNSNLGFTLSGFPDFALGEGFLITYKTALTDDALSKDSIDLWNGAYPIGKDINDGEVQCEAVYWERLELNKIEKNGQQDAIEASDGTIIPVIKWEVEIKKSESNLEGTVVIDTLGEGLKYYQGQPIKVERYDQSGDNSLGTATINWSNVQINGNSMSFELPEGYRYVIVYYTTYEELQEGEHKNYTNTAKVTINHKEEVAGGTVDVVGFIPRISKSASGNDGEYVYFTIEADVPAAIKNWGSFFLTDMAAFWGYSYVENKPKDMVITAITESGQIDFTPYTEGGPTENTFILVAPAGGDMHHSFNVYFNTSEANAESSKWILNEDAKLIITYKIPFDAKIGNEWTGELTGDETVGEVLLDGRLLANEAYLNYTKVITAKTSTTYGYSPKIVKDSVINDNGTIDYTVIFNNTNGNSAYLNNKTLSAYFTDTFDEKLEYVDGTLTVTCYAPGNNSLWLNKYTYNGTIQGNKMKVPTSAFILSETNPAAESWKNLDTIGDFETYYKSLYEWGSKGGRYVFTYTLKLKDEYFKTVDYNHYTLDNTAEIIWDNDGSSGSATETVEYNTGLLDKQVVQENKKLDFDIHINRHALDILDGIDNLTIEDTMTPNLSLYWDSIKLYYEDENGNWIDFDSTDNKEYKHTVTYDQASNTLTFVVPDELHIRIDYSTLITENGKVSVQNTVTINASAQLTDIINATFQVQEHSGGATGSMHDITLLKQDGDTDERLSGVTFLLYGPMGDPDATVPPGAVGSFVTEKNKTVKYIGSYTTGADGTVVIKTQYLTQGGPYALVETVPPEGYNPLDKPVYFYFYNADPNGIIQTVTTLIAVENYTYGYVLPETGGTGTLSLAIIGFAIMTLPILYSTIRRKRERRLT